MSAGTMVCCAADELVMGRHSFLGPIDPQMNLDTATGMRPVPAGAILSQFKRAKEDITEDESNVVYWTPILRQYGPGLIEECEQAMELSQELAKEWAQEYLLADKPEPQSAAEELASDLTDYEEFKVHSRHLHRNKAREHGFEITDLEEDDDLQDLVLTLYHATTLAHDTKGIVKIIETHEGNTFLTGPPQNATSGSQAGSPSNAEAPAGPPQPEDIDFDL
jgi:hypothetical protein